MKLLESFVSDANTILWSYVLIIMLIGLGIYFTIRITHYAI
jgi:AGCS family alanine or glycine:cation symporter